ncbi:hypothetical protein KFE94_13085 [bacterium SCSIO 12643]|nr:hypothetical protein KFE94_13085 [bacterium SCSIO 12643]
MKWIFTFLSILAFQAYGQKHIDAKHVKYDYYSRIIYLSKYPNYPRVETMDDFEEYYLISLRVLILNDTNNNPDNNILLVEKLDSFNGKKEPVLWVGELDFSTLFPDIKSHKINFVKWINPRSFEIEINNNPFIIEISYEEHHISGRLGFSLKEE